MTGSTSDDRTVAITVLLPTRDRAAMLERCVESVLRSTHPDFELVVVDQSPVPSTFTDPRVRVVRSTARGKSAALNEGARVARGTVLAFVDDDCTVDPGWLDHVAATFASRPDVSLVFGNLAAAPHDPAVTFVPTADMGRPEVVVGASCAWRRGGAGANLAMRRTLFDALGGFDPMIGPGAPIPACEEFDLYYRTLAAGDHVLRDPSSVVVHWGGRSLDDGTAGRLLAGYHFGEGAVIGKHLRLRDPVMALVGARILAQHAREVVRSIVDTRRLAGSGVTRIAHVVRGIGRGLTSGVDRPRRMFRPM